MTSAHEGTYFLVMPRLEGQTLADRLRKGALPPDQAIRFAIEIATALDVAHRHGIIHRDLKPGNIMLTKSGVKLLDFGLAKLKKAFRPARRLRRRQKPGTGVGTLLGTMPYMSPEQIEGREVDARSDIFSRGAVIYEMVTGQRAFKGESPASVIGAILKDEPAPMRTLTVDADRARSRRHHCLAKDPDERWQSAADMARELKWMASATVQRREGAYCAQPWRERAAWIAVIGILLRSGSRAPTSPIVATPSARLSVNPTTGNGFTAKTSATVPTPQFAVSPDGRRLRLLRRPRNSVRRCGCAWMSGRRQLPATGGAQEPFGLRTADGSGSSTAWQCRRRRLSLVDPCR